MATTHETAARRGRPPRLSRQQIVEAVSAMLLADPSAPLTITRAAEVVGAAPMSLYRHFADRDDLVGAVAEHVFSGTRPAADAGTPWQDVVRAWMTGVFDQACRVPRLMQLIASGESAEWLPDASFLARTLEQAGIHDDERVAEAIYWISTTTMGHALIHAARAEDRRADRLRATLQRVDDDDAARLFGLLPHLAALGDDGFARVVEWTISGLERMLTN
jgi:AcrR family transcriptional regulator